MSNTAYQGPKALFRWEQDGAGGDHGMATFFPETPHEITVRIETFKEAHRLLESICAALEHKHWDARAGILAEIGRIKP